MPLSEALARVEHLAQIYHARAGRKVTPDWSAEQKRQDAGSADALDTLIAAVRAEGFHAKSAINPADQCVSPAYQLETASTHADPDLAYAFMGPGSKPRTEK